MVIEFHAKGSWYVLFSSPGIDGILPSHLYGPHPGLGRDFLGDGGDVISTISMAAVAVAVALILRTEDGIGDLAFVLLQLDEDAPGAQMLQSSDGHVVGVEAGQEGLNGRWFGCRIISTTNTCSSSPSVHLEELPHFLDGRSGFRPVHVDVLFGEPQLLNVLGGEVLAGRNLSEVDGGLERHATSIAGPSTSLCRFCCFCWFRRALRSILTTTAMVVQIESHRWRWRRRRTTTRCRRRRPAGGVGRGGVLLALRAVHRVTYRIAMGKMRRARWRPR
mmetsp:Transcript_22653/g.65220  ORF Transcript_22653/g.65220 Transcript_22653/m.65220 type:complete len:276 (-) Transcript_22653:296-1123(-)